LSLPLLQKIFLATAQSAQQNAPRSHLLQGRPLKIADGATVRLEDTPKNRRARPGLPDSGRGRQVRRDTRARPDYPRAPCRDAFSLSC
jgi:hypothetical protein